MTPREMFEKFLSEVPEEKRRTKCLQWTPHLELLVRSHYGIGTERMTVQQMTGHFGVDESRIQQLLGRATRICRGFYCNREQEAVRQQHRAKLAAEVRAAFAAH